ncbi:MAG: ACT domain-containing protein [Clostridia bacterium]|nr:ACT domain-containing protein [Clostridia bacterium]
MKAVITVIGKDIVGILAKVSTMCAKYNINIMDVTQSVLQDLFAMIMLVDMKTCTIDFKEFVDKMALLGEDENLKIHVMHEDIFNSMHKI